MKFVTLTMIVKENVIRGGAQPQSYSNEPSGEDDGLEQLDENASGQQSAEIVSIAPTHEVVESKPVTIGIDSIRNFYPRKNNVPGSRVVLKSGVAYVVSETHDEVLAKVNSSSLA